MKTQKTLAAIVMLISVSVFAQQTQVSRARATLDYGDRFWAASRFNEALPYYDQARQLALTAPQDVQVLISLSHRYLAYRNEAAGWDCFDKSTSIAYSFYSQSPDWSKYWLREAVSFHNQSLVSLMNQVGTSQNTRTALANRVNWIQNLLTGGQQQLPPGATSVAITIYSRSVASGSRISVGYIAPGRAGRNDWLALYKVGVANEQYGEWKRVTEERGSFEYTAPGEPGTYEFRYMLENGYKAETRSVSFQVTAAGTTGTTGTGVTGPVRPIDWNYMPTEHRGQDGKRFAFACPAGTATRLFGTGVYTDDSSVCTAGVHAGVISAAMGGTVVIEIRPGQSSYPASSSNGVTSVGWGNWPGGFAVVR